MKKNIKKERKPLGSKCFNATVEVKGVTYDVEAIDHVMSVFKDGNYGADADGNRGMSVTEIEETEIEIESIYVGDTDVTETLDADTKELIIEELISIAEDFSMDDYGWDEGDEWTEPLGFREDY
jgi:hypothetical protein